MKNLSLSLFAPLLISIAVTPTVGYAENVAYQITKDSITVLSTYQLNCPEGEGWFSEEMTDSEEEHGGCWRHSDDGLAIFMYYQSKDVPPVIRWSKDFNPMPKGAPL